MNDETTTTAAPRLGWHEFQPIFGNEAASVSTSLLFEVALCGLCAAVGLYWQRSKVGIFNTGAAVSALDLAGGAIAVVGVLLLLWVVARVARSAWTRWPRTH